LLVLGFKLANALLLGSERFANASATSRLFIDLDQPSPHGCLSKLHVAADLATLKPCSRIICTTCSLNSALNVRLCLLLMFLVQVKSTYRGIRGN
jgi:hypothetical protein